MPDASPAPPSPSRADRFRGALLGLAVGDALGTTVEFRPRGSFAPLTDIVGGGPFDLPAGAWTDDTSMALCLADSLLERRRHDAADVLRRYVRWYRHGERSSTGRCFDIGNATRQALERFERTHDPDAGVAFPDAGGNGVLMRLAPLAMAHAFARGAAIDAAIRESNATHGHPGARDAAKLFAALLVDALRGGDRESVLGPDGRFMSAPLLHDDVRPIAAGSFRADGGATVPDHIRGGGFAPTSLEAALWAVWSTRTFADAVLAAANLGDDADTTAAIAGQLAGALYGADAIPRSWRRIVHLGDEIEALADGLLALGDELSAGFARLPRMPGAPDLDPRLPNDAFWLRDGRVLAGPYPGAPTKQEATEKLDALLDLGVRWFVDLTEAGEGPGPHGLHPYDRLLRSRAAARGIDGVWHVRLPIRDVSVPTFHEMRTILDVVQRAPSGVYVHCWGGVGRTGTVLGCLAVDEGATGSEALAEVAHARRFTARARAGRVAPETVEQRAFVAAWPARHDPRPDDEDEDNGTDGSLTAGAPGGSLAVGAPDGTGGSTEADAPNHAGGTDPVDALAAVAAAGRRRYDEAGELPSDLDELRGTLFFGFRADRFSWGDDVELSAPDDDGVRHFVNARRSEDEGDDARFRRAIVQRIRGIVGGRDGG
ncbi:MAG: ADP-ribosylglycohydrolase family protein [Solirubrobacteraceae bacterium]|nr:ADP-ribosylglycohydrolase family protein [Solirubrobacteraceae bacterium]